MFVNGNSVGTSTNGSINDLDDNVTIGRFDEGDGRYFDGDIAEVLVYSDPLNQAQRIIVENYLSSKYGISLAANDVYAGEVNGFLHQVAGIGQHAGLTHSEGGSGGFLLRMNNPATFTNGEFVLAGHNNTPNAATTADVSAPVQNRWARSWFVDATGTVDTEISFDLNSEGINGAAAGVASNYVLLYRSSNSGSFAVVPGTSASVSGSRISFPVTNLNTDGYYTLGSSDETNSPVTGVGNKIWYTLQSGNWNNPNVWTLDGGTSPKQQPVGGGVPGPADQVVITNAKDVTMTENDYEVAGATIFGTLDVANTTGHALTTISGNGRISIAGSPTGADNFPAGDASAFAAAGQGTVRLYGTGITLNTHTFNDMEVMMSTNSDVVTLLDNLTLNGNLDIETGNLRINDNSATIPLRFNVASNVTINDGASMSVGTANAYTNRMGGTYGDYHESFHVMYVGGNFNNNGQVRFTNQTEPDYDSHPTNGAVSLVFTGAANRQFNCYGVTDLYNLVVDKGSQTYELTLDVNKRNHFALFGQNDDNWNTNGGNGANPEMQKALWIKNGTLRLTGKTYIPTLTEGGRDWTIGENAALVLDGGDVFVSATAITGNRDRGGSVLHPAIDYTDLSYSSATGFDNGNGNQGIYINGTLRVNDGFFTTGYSHGLVYRAESPNNRLEIHGGEVRAGQFRISGSANPANAKMSYIQHGGTLRLTDNRTNAAIFDLKAAQSSFTMKGGEIIIEDLSDGATNAIEIASPLSNIDVTGGTVIIDNISGDQRTAIISTTAPFYNFVLRSNRDREVRLNTPLTVANDIVIEKENFNANGNDLTIVGDMEVAGAGSYTTGDNTTTFIGGADSEIKFDNTTGVQAIQRLTLNKSDPTLVLDVKGTLTTLQIDGELRVTQGKLQHEAKNIHAKSDLHNTGAIGSNSTGAIVFNGGVAQTVTAETGVFTNVTIDNTNSVVATTALVVRGTLALANGVLDINTHRLSLQGSQAAITTATTFDNTRMIQTAGNASDGGLEMYADANETLLFPVGTNANSTARYTPATTILSGVLDDGYVQISVADRTLHTTNPFGDALSYYWRVRHREFGTLPTVEHQFTYANSDVVGTVTDYVGGKVLSGNPFTRSGEDFRDGNADNTIDASEGTANINSVNETTNLIIFNFSGSVAPVTNNPINLGFQLEAADYTAGESSRFVGAPTIYYNTNVGRRDWDNGTKWTSNPDGADDGVNAFPGAGDVAIIKNYGQGNGNAWVDANIDISVAKLIFDNSLGGWSPRLWVTKRDATLDLGQVEGAGTFYLEVTAAQSPVFSDGTDLGSFVNENASEFNFRIDDDNQTVNLPTNIRVYPRLRIEGGDGANDDNNRVLQTSVPITVRRDVRMDRSSRFRINHNVTVKEDVRVTWQGNRTTLEIGDDREVVVDIQGNLSLENGQGNDDSRILVKNDNQNGYLHTLRVGGNITLENVGNGSSVFDLYNGAAPNNNAILELSGEGKHAFTNASTISPELYRIVMNKGIDTASTFTMRNTIALQGTSTGATKAIELQNGLLIFDHPNFGNTDSRIELADDTTDPFYIPPTAGLEIRQGRLRVSGDANILLDGLLRISNAGHLDMGCGNCDRHIEYGSSGKATIEVTGGWLDVASQIRRSPSNDAGVLKFRQTGGTVSVGRGGAKNNLYENRGMLEVLNAGSEFTLTGGDFTIYQQNGNVPTVAALILDPDFYNLTGSTIHIGGQPTQPDGANNFTPADQDNVGIDASIPLNDVVINDHRSTPARIVDKALTIAGDLTIQSNSTLDANGLTLTLLGNMNVDDNFVASSNKTVFNGSAAQVINGKVDFYDLTKTSGSLLTLTNPATTTIGVGNDLTIASGTFNDGGNTVALMGDLIIDGTHASGATGDGIAFVGTTQQELRRSSAGSSSLGRVTVNNSAGVVVPEGDGYSFTLQNNLRLSSGVFNIGSNLLSLATNAEIEAVNPFGENNMIETNNSAFDFGVQKFFAANRTADFLFPIGQGNYTPVRIDLSSDGSYSFGNTAGSIRIAPVNEMHPTINSDANKTHLSDNTTLDDRANVLQYYWTIDADNISTSFKGNLILEYNQEDLVRVEDPDYTEADYITAVLLSDNNAAANITKTSGMVDDIANTLKFAFDGVTDQGVSGDYFAGIDLAIPDQIPIYTTIQSGNVDAAIYDTNPPGGIPNGAIVVVDAAHTLTFNQENVRFYQTEIRSTATLDLASTSIHSLGQLSGQGTLRVENDASLGLKQGSTFFDCGQGTLEYSGNSNYNVLASMPTVNRVRFTGTSARILPANNVVVCDDMIVDGPVLRNENNINVTIQGDTYVTSGSFETGSGNIDHQQNLNINGGTYRAQNGGNDIVREDLILSAGTFNGGTTGKVTLLGDLTYSGGTFTGGSGTALFVLGGTTPQTVTGTIAGVNDYFHRLEINNSAGVTLANNVDVAKALVLTEGLITPNATFKLRQGATTGTGKATSYVNGILHRDIADNTGGTLHFPVGKAERWGNIAISAPDGAGTWQAEYFNHDPSNDDLYNDDLSTDRDDPTIQVISQLEYWSLLEPSGRSAHVHLRWDDKSKVSPVPTERDNLRVLQWDGTSKWKNRGNTLLSGDESYGTFRSSALANLSQQYFTLGSTSQSNQLPVELISFTADAQEQTVQLVWETATEINNDYFEVQRSVDGINFKKIGEVAGNGNTVEVIRYEFVDQMPVSGISYYQLKQVDFDGAFEHSDKISVEWINAGFVAGFVEVNLYPNPAPQGQAKLKVTGLRPNSTVTFKLLDMFGKPFMQQVLETDMLSQQGFMIQPRARLSTGVYVVSVQQGSEVHQKTMIVR